MGIRRFFSKLGVARKRESFFEMSTQMIQTLDPLDFLTPETSGASSQDVLAQLNSVMHGAMEEVGKAIQLVFEQLSPEGNISNHLILEANGQIRNEKARAESIADLKRDELSREIRNRLEIRFLYDIIQSPYQEPSVKRWENLSTRTVRRDLPLTAEHSYNDLVDPADRRRRLPRWRSQLGYWLEDLCQNHVAEIVEAMEAEIKEYLSSWYEITPALKKRASLGGGLFQEVTNPELWSFESEDPTVRNLLRGEQALAIAHRILDRFQLSNSDAFEVAEDVRRALAGVSVYGTNRVGLQQLEDLLAEAMSQKIQDNVSLEAGFLSIISHGARFGEDLGELLADMHRGASAMEQKLWRVGEVGVGHVDSASGVGITASNVHDIVLRGLGGGRKFAAVEGHPGDNHRFDVQMSIVGAPAEDLSMFREMVTAWYAWHFAENRGSCSTQSEWLKNVTAECWKLYPDIGTDTGVRNAIIELIDEDLKAMRDSREELVPRVSNGLPSDQILLHGLWKELGVIADGAIPEYHPPVS
jgi:hypothetical protein